MKIYITIKKDEIPEEVEKSGLIKSWKKTSSEVMRMITVILGEQIVDETPFNMLRWKRFLYIKKEFNCIAWAIQKYRIANIKLPDQTMRTFLPDAYVRSLNSVEMDSIPQGNYQGTYSLVG